MSRRLDVMQAAPSVMRAKYAASTCIRRTRARQVTPNDWLLGARRLNGAALGWTAALTLIATTMFLMSFTKIPAASLAKRNSFI